KSTRISRVGDKELTVAGDLTIHGVTRNVTFTVEGPTPPAKDPWGNIRLGLSATTKINRKDFGLTWNTALETGGLLVGDEVTITLDLQFVKALIIRGPAHIQPVCCGRRKRKLCHSAQSNGSFKRSPPSRVLA